MNKTVKIIIAIAVVVLAILVGGFVISNNSKPASNLNINTAEDFTALIDQIYAETTIEMPMLATIPLDATDADVVKVYAGLENGDDLEYLVVSEPMMTSQAYSLVLAKVKDGVDVEKVAKTMNENINERKWICVTAEKIHTTTSGNVICLVMSNADTAKTVYDSFKKLAGSVGQEYERTAEEPEMPEDMLVAPSDDTLEAPAGDEPAAMPDDMLVDDQPAAMPDVTVE